MLGSKTQASKDWASILIEIGSQSNPIVLHLHGSLSSDGWKDPYWYEIKFMDQL